MKNVSSVLVSSFSLASDDIGLECVNELCSLCTELSICYFLLFYF